MSNFLNLSELIKDDYIRFENFVDESIVTFSKMCNNGTGYTPYKGLMSESTARDPINTDVTGSQLNIININDKSYREIFFNAGGSLQIRSPSCGLMFLSIIPGFQNVKIYQIYQAFHEIKFTLHKITTGNNLPNPPSLIKELNTKILNDAHIIFCSKTQNLFNIAIKYNKYEYSYNDINKIGTRTGKKSVGADFKNAIATDPKE